MSLRVANHQNEEIMPIYVPGQPWEPNQYAAMIAIGDSWFWYPHNSILTALAAHPSLRDPYRNMQMLGFNGAELQEYVYGRYAPEFKRELKPINSKYYSAVLISGAGNDAVAYHLGLRDDCRGIAKAADCIDAAGMDDLIQKISRSMAVLIHDVSWEISRQGRTVDIFIHGYDYPVPDGRGFVLIPDVITLAGPWLRPAMDKAGVLNDLDLRKEICRIMIDGVNDAFAKFGGTAGPGYRANYIDCRGTLSSGAPYQADWANELHPTRAGFDKIVDQKWIPVLRSLNYAT